MAATLEITTPRPTIFEFQDRVSAVVEHPLWPQVHNEYYRTTIETAHANLRQVRPKELELTLGKVEDLLNKMAIGKRRRELEKARKSITERRWFGYFKTAYPATAAVLNTELPEHSECTPEHFEVLEDSIAKAKDWSREQQEQRVNELAERCDSAMQNDHAFEEFAHVDPEAHALISAGPALDMNLRPLVDAVFGFERWTKVFTRGERTLDRMGLSTTPVGKTNRGKGNKAKRRH